MTVSDYIESRHDANLNELKEFLKIPSVSTKAEHKADLAQLRTQHKASIRRLTQRRKSN